MESIDDGLVDELMIKEKGMDPAVYEDQAKFNARRLPQIEKQVEAELGYEKAHTAIQSDTMATVSNATLTDIVVETQTGRTPIDEAVSEEFGEFIMAKRSIQKREQSACNQEFIEEHIGQFGEREIIYNGEYTSTLVVEATKAEINYYARLNVVEGISYYVDYIPEPCYDIVFKQVGVYTTGGTGYDGYDWMAQKGHGVKIGIIEAYNYCYDSQVEQLSNNSKLSIIYNDIPTNPDEPYKVATHATSVTSIIAGRPILIGSRRYEGGSFCGNCLSNANTFF